MNYIEADMVKIPYGYLKLWLYAPYMSSMRVLTDLYDNKRRIIASDIAGDIEFLEP